jgi:GH3 auxin-responsive promoter
MRPIIQLFRQMLKPTAKRFDRSLAQPQLAQASVQKSIGERLIASEYGKALGINSIDDWQRVPIVTYEDLEPWILKTSQFPTRSALTPEPILFYERTSGSSGAAKSIPYTRSLRQSFSQMFCVWAHDLLEYGPRFSTGKLYACISPQLDDKQETIQDDSDYLDGWLQTILSPFLVMPQGLQQLRDPQIFQHRLALALLQAEHLETISIWSPSFLEVQLGYIRSNQQLLQQALHDRISADRLALLGAASIPWTQLWADLKLISCWDSVNSADRATGLRSQFPGVLVQGKGLLATEAPITIPSIAAGGYLPMLDRVFLEFEDDLGEIYQLHELNTDKVYQLILSQLGGLYRYRLGDRVRVTHWYRQTPCLEFVGRSQTTSDLVGEKLSIEFVRTTLDRLQLANSSFTSLVPVANPPHYVLLLDRSTADPDSIALALDQILSEAYHYHRARLLGQLLPPQVLISSQFPEAIATYQAERGSVWAGIKFPILATAPIDRTLLIKLQQIAN